MDVNKPLITAIKRWEDTHPDQNITEATEINFQFQHPPISKLDSTIACLKQVHHLNLNTNLIETVAGVPRLKHLTILHLNRNYIRNLIGIEILAGTLEELWLAYNFIEKLKLVHKLKKLRVLHMSYNLVKDWKQLNKLRKLLLLENISFIGNPVRESIEESFWKWEVIKLLPNLKMLDDETVFRNNLE